MAPYIDFEYVVSKPRFSSLQLTHLAVLEPPQVNGRSVNSLLPIRRLLLEMDRENLVFLWAYDQVSYRHFISYAPTEGHSIPFGLQRENLVVRLFPTTTDQTVNLFRPIVQPRIGFTVVWSLSHRGWEIVFSR